MVDLLVSIPSRNREVELYRTMEMLYKTCASRDNFDVQIVLDNDRRGLYTPFMTDYPDLIYTFVDYAGGHWQNIINAQDDYFLDSNYYFFWILPDDMTGLGAEREMKWDEEILDKKGFFADDLFVLFTHGAGGWGRTVAEHKACYTTCLDAHEPDPVWTKKWCEFLAPLFRPPSQYIIYRELIIAGLLKVLFMEHGENRNVETLITWANIVNDGNTIKYSQCWDDLVKRDLDDLRPIAKRMKEYIDGFRLH